MKLENEIIIPLEENWSENWIKYNKSVFIIRADPGGTSAQFQYDGTLCKQGFIKGFIHSQFKTKAKYFQPDWWYKKTNWGLDYPKRIFFTDTKGSQRHLNADIENPNYSISKWYDKCNNLAAEMGRPADKILENIIKTTIKRTGVNMIINFEDIDYGVSWWEALIPIKFGDKLEYKGILTWENCD